MEMVYMKKSKKRRNLNAAKFVVAVLCGCTVVFSAGIDTYAEVYEKVADLDTSSYPYNYRSKVTLVDGVAGATKTKKPVVNGDGVKLGLHSQKANYSVIQGQQTPVQYNVINSTATNDEDNTALITSKKDVNMTLMGNPCFGLNPSYSYDNDTGTYKIPDKENNILRASGTASGRNSQGHHGFISVKADGNVNMNVYDEESGGTDYYPDEDKLGKYYTGSQGYVRYNSYSRGMFATTGGAIKVNSEVNTLTLNEAGSYIDTTMQYKGSVGMESYNGAFVSLKAKSGDNTIYVGKGGWNSTHGAMANLNGSELSLKAEQGTNTITVAPAASLTTPTVFGMAAYGYTSETLPEDVSSAKTKTTAKMKGLGNTISATGTESTRQVTGVAGYYGGQVSVTAAHNEETGAASRDNTITVKGVDSKTTLFAVAADSQGTVAIKNDDANNVITIDADSQGAGAVAVNASRNGKVTVEGKSNTISADASGVQAAYGIQSLGGTIEVTAKNGGTNTITGRTAAVFAGTDGAGKAATNIAITGKSDIGRADSDVSAIISSAGDSELTSQVAVNYDGESQIHGDMSAYGKGQIFVKAAESADSAKIHIDGAINAYGTEPSDQQSAMSGGMVDLALSNGSSFTGTADTGLVYHTATGKNVAAGTVNLDLAYGALWTMTGSSAVSQLSGNGAVTFQDGGKSLQIDELSGAHTFAMDLSKNGLESDMLYIGKGTSDKQTLQVKNLDALDSSMDAGDAVRFATIRENSQDEFSNGRVLKISPNGVRNAQMKIQYRDAVSDPLNTAAYSQSYNGDSTAVGDKPTTAAVEASYGGADAKNVYVVKENEDTPNAGGAAPGKAAEIVWRFATDLDTHTKRESQAKYFQEDHNSGMWVRTGYKRFGIDDVGKLSGNSYELGYTHTVKNTAETKHNVGASFSYSYQHGDWDNYGGDFHVKDYYIGLYDMHEYHPSEEALAGKPEWKKDTYTYWDNYLKFHRIKADYSAVDRETNVLYDADYDQNIVNLSTEYGKKVPLSHSWYWVPQGQMQLSYLGGYDYTDSQGLHADADHDWSLIGRLGFDLVKQLNAKYDSRIYLKASVVHEFLDGADVRTTSFGTDHFLSGMYLDEGDRKGTWGVFGAGYSSRLGDHVYGFLDFEKAVGNDWNQTYHIMGGINWKF